MGRQLKPAHILSGAALVAVCAAFIAPWEGLRTAPYYDGAGVLTICYGETAGVTPGMRLSKAECVEMLRKSIPKYLEAVDSVGPLSQEERIAYTDFVYNVGPGAWRRSGIYKLIKAGKRTEACNGLLAWDKIKGKISTWQQKRRLKERQLCLSGLKASSS